MSYFWLNSTLLLEISLIALGLVVLHHSKKENAHLLKVAGSVLLIGALILMPITGYRMFRYCSGEGCHIDETNHSGMQRGWKHGDPLWKNDASSSNNLKANEPTYEK